GETILARPASATERVSKWIRRRPAQTAALLLTFVLVGGGLWVILEKWTVSRAVEGDLKDAETAEQRSSWDAAAAALERARVRMGSGGPVYLRQRLNRIAQELEFVSRLDRIRSSRAASVNGKLSRSGVEYYSAFIEEGIFKSGEDPVA